MKLVLLKHEREYYKRNFFCRIRLVEGVKIGMKIMIELEEAMEAVLSRIQPVEKESVSIADSYHRVLAQNVTSQIDMPPFARSPLDGYAYLATSSDPIPLQLKVVSEIPAGTFSEREIFTGEAAKIFTGAPIPPGANSVVRNGRHRVRFG